jgi:hypothetical protein
MEEIEEEQDLSLEKGSKGVSRSNSKKKSKISDGQKKYKT